jgi:uncharacterized protein YndB with AHSA1/START domain
MIAPVVREVVAASSVEDAFRGFTDDIGRWWPTHTHSIHGADCAGVVFEHGVGGRLYEVSPKGSVLWGTVRTWDPPRAVVFSWHPGREASTAQEVEVTFERVESGTRVRLVHRGWDALGEKAVEARTQYDEGWVGVLELYTRQLGRAAGITAPL